MIEIMLHYGNLEIESFYKFCRIYVLGTEL
jgi:hypothetical protein